MKQLDVISRSPQRGETSYRQHLVCDETVLMLRVFITEAGAQSRVSVDIFNSFNRVAAQTVNQRWLKLTSNTKLHTLEETCP